jgi:uncharacterized protein
MFWKPVMATVLLVFWSATVVGQAQPSSSDPVPSREEVMKFLEITQARSRVAQMLEGMAKLAREGAEQGFKQKIPDATPEQLYRVDRMADAIFEDFRPDEFIDAVVPIYQKHLSKADQEAILAFYSSPAGQKVLKEMPAIMAESMDAGGEIGRKKMAAVNQKIEQQIADMAREEQAKREKDQKRQPAKD